MAQDPIIGTWVVTLFEGGRAKYKYRYSCSAPPKKGAAVARWSDYWDPGSKGTGTWARAGNQINFTWPGSSTTNEYLVIAPTTQSDKASGKAMTTYGTFSTVAERTDIVDPAQDIIQQWADNYGDYQSPHICPWAIPYMLFCAPRKVTYNTKNYGPPLNRVRGLAIHLPGRTDLPMKRGWSKAPSMIGIPAWRARISLLGIRVPLYKSSR